MKLKILVTIIFVMMSLKVFANYEIKLFLDSTKDNINIVDWSSTSPSFTSWTEKGGNFDCSSWNPNENTIIIGQSFERTRDCYVNEERFRQERSLSDTGNYRNDGDPIIEKRISPRTETNQSIGTLETWVSTTPTYTSWINSGDIYGCNTWLPEPSTVDIGTVFTQTSYDCELDQTRNRQDREQETTTLTIRNSGSLIIENQTLTNQTNTKSSTGTKENWVATTPTYTDWINSTSIYGCSNWNPAPDTVTIYQSFTQTANDCELDQTRNKQNREQETTTLTIRNNGSLIVENQTLTNQTNTRLATGTKENWVATTPTYTSWVNSGVIYGCNTWTPDPATVNSGTVFTQTSYDCELDQTRNKQNREQETTTLTIRNNGSLIVENQTLTNQTNTRSATGTKVVPVCMYSGLQYIWSTGSTSYVAWAGSTIASGYSGTSVSKGGYLYTRGTYMGNTSNIANYQVCRQPL